MKELEQAAKVQFGVVSRAQVLAALGYRSSLAWKVKRGELEKVHELAYRLRGAPSTWERSATEALIIGGEGSALSHRTAAWLHRLDGFDKPGVIDVSTNWNGTRKFPSVNFHRTRNGAGSPVIARGLPITTVQRTIVDLAAELESEALELALDSAQRRYKGFGPWLESHMAALDVRGTPGLSELRRLIELRGGLVTDSPFEVKVLRKLRDSGLFPDETPCEVFDLAGNYVMRLDFAWRALMVALHVDSYRWHQQKERFDRDARQRSQVSALGWKTVTVTYANFAGGEWLSNLQTLLSPQRSLSFA